MGTGKRNAGIGGFTILCVAAVIAPALLVKMQIVLNSLAAPGAGEPDQNGQGQKTADRASYIHCGKQPIEERYKIIHDYLQSRRPPKQPHSRQNRPNVTRTSSRNRKNANRGSSMIAWIVWKKRPTTPVRYSCIRFYLLKKRGSGVSTPPLAGPYRCATLLRPAKTPIATVTMPTKAINASGGHATHHSQIVVSRLDT